MIKISLNFKQPVSLPYAELVRKYCGLLAELHKRGLLTSDEYQRFLWDIDAEDTTGKEEY